MDQELDEQELDNSVDDQQETAPAPRGPATEATRILEALVFASSEPMPIARLKELLPDNPDARVIRTLVRQINENLQVERHPFEIVEIGGGYQFRTVSYYQPWVQQLFKEKSTKRLSIQSLECLAIIAYRQPITKAEIEAVRGVTSDGAMKTLLERRLVTIAGRSEKAGRPLLYGSTQTFLNYFGLNKITDLPRIEEFEAMAREKMEELSEEELQQIESLPEADEGSDEGGKEGVQAEGDTMPAETLDEQEREKNALDSDLGESPDEELKATNISNSEGNSADQDEQEQEEEPDPDQVACGEDEPQASA